MSGQSYRNRPETREEHYVDEARRGIVPSDELEFIDWLLLMASNFRRALANRSLDLFVKFMYDAYQLGKRSEF